MEVTLISIEESPSLIFPVMQEKLRSAGHKCKYVFIPLQHTSEEKVKQLAQKIAKVAKDSGLIGLSCMTNTYPAGIMLLAHLKKYIDTKKTKIIVGGVHPTMKPFDLEKHADYVCVGEGEEALLELVEKLAHKKKTDNICNIYINKGGKLKVNPLRPIIDNLNSFPTPYFNFTDTYTEHNGNIVSLANDTENKELLNKFYRKYYFVITSRGCPYRCTYCLNSALIRLHKGYIKIRRRSKEHVLTELSRMKEILPKDITLGFVDDDFCAQPLEDLKSFCAAYKTQIGLPFFCASTPSSMNEEKLKCLLDAGLIRLEIGIQTISDKINQQVFRRYATKKQAVALSQMLSRYRHKVEICYDFILDNNWETDETRLETLNFILTLDRPFYLFLFSLTPYPGTELYERAKSEGLLVDDSVLYKKNHMLLNNNKINTLIVLYNRYKFPKFIIKGLIQVKDLWPFSWTLQNSTYLLWRAYNYYYGLKDSIKRKDFKSVRYYLIAPFTLLTKTGKKYEEIKF